MMPRTKSRWLALGAVAAVAGGALWTWRARSSAATTARPSATGTEVRGANGGMEGMEGMAGMSPSPGGDIALTADQLRTFGVTFGTAEIRPMTNVVRAAGNVVVDETRIV